jgi:hypothetical protein
MPVKFNANRERALLSFPKFAMAQAVFLTSGKSEEEKKRQMETGNLARCLAAFAGQFGMISGIEVA